MNTTNEVRGGSGAMFDQIAPRYDLLNRVMSLGLDARWRRRAVEQLELPANARVLDLATGTGDVALEIARTYPDAQIVGLDPSEGMLEIGRQKATEAGAPLEMIVGDAESPPFDDDSFDAITMAFGIRNVPNRPQALQQARRVLRPGGRLVILELTEPTRGPLAPMARLFVRSVIPTVGAALSRAEAYSYLPKSITAFPAPEAFAEMMREAGFSQVTATPLDFAVCTLFCGVAGERK